MGNAKRFPSGHRPRHCPPLVATANSARVRYHSDPKVGNEIRGKLDAICGELGLQYHGVRYRTMGYRQIMEAIVEVPITSSEFGGTAETAS